MRELIRPGFLGVTSIAPVAPGAEVVVASRPQMIFRADRT